MQPQTRLLLRTARDLRKVMPALTIEQAIGLSTSVIGIVQGHMEDIANEMVKGK